MAQSMLLPAAVLLIGVVRCCSCSARPPRRAADAAWAPGARAGAEPAPGAETRSGAETRVQFTGLGGRTGLAGVGSAGGPRGQSAAARAAMSVR
jgi:hypothetical protein